MKRFLFLIAFFLSSSAIADDYKIIAVVNEDVITNVILEERVNLAIKSSGLQNNAEVRKKVTPQVLQILIDEKLKSQEATRLRIRVEDEEINNAIKELEKQNNVGEGQFKTFLSRNNLSEESVKEQIKSQISWKKVILQKVRPKINISNSEVEQAYQMMIAKNNTRQVEISEILLPVTNKNEEEAKATANKLFDEIKKNPKNFSSIARQFSTSSTAEKGGEMGWVQQEQLDKEISEKLLFMKKGEVSEPIRTDKGYHIILLKDIRDFAKFNNDEGEVKLKNVFIPFAPKEPDELRAKKRELLGRIRKKTTCDNFSSTQKEFKDYIVAFKDLGTTSIKTLSNEIRPAISATEAGQNTSIVTLKNGITFFAVCEKVSASPELPDRTKLKDIIGAQKMELEARRYLKNLHDSAYIEIRL